MCDEDDDLGGPSTEKAVALWDIISKDCAKCFFQCLWIYLFCNQEKNMQKMQFEIVHCTDPNLPYLLIMTHMPKSVEVGEVV